MKQLLFSLFLMLSTCSLFAGGEDVKLFSMSPVPLNVSKFTVKLLNSNTSIHSIEIRNLIGRKLQEKKIPQGGESVVFTEMDIYPNGLYVIFAKDAYGKIIESSKFIINK